MAMRYFFSENADRPMFIGSTRYTFEIVARIAGTSQGVVAIEDDKADAFLAAGAQLGVEEITAEAYADALEKKKRNPRSQVSVSLDRPSPGPQLAVPIKGNGGVAVESGNSVPKAAGPVLPSIDEAFDLSAPETPAPAQTSPTLEPKARKPRAAKKEA